MSELVLRSPSVGGVIKKIIQIAPDLSAHQVIDIVRQSILTQGEAKNLPAGEFASAEVIDEEKALRLAKAAAQQLPH